MGTPVSERIQIIAVHYNLQPYHRARYNCFLRAHGHHYSISVLLLGATKEYELVKQRYTDQDLFDLCHLGKAGGFQPKISAKGLDENLRRLRPDLVLLVGGYAPPEMRLVILQALKRRIPCVLCSETTEHDETRLWWREGLKGLLIRQFGAILVGGAPHKEYMLRLGADSSRVFQGYDAVDNDLFSAGSAWGRERAESLRSRLCLPNRYFVACSRFVEKKNLPFVLQAYARYRQLASFKSRDIGTAGAGVHGPTPGGATLSGNSNSEARLDPWHLVLLGDGPLRPQICREAEALAVKSYIAMPGFQQVDELPWYYGLAGAFIHGSTVEQWGLVVNEAMASGLPVLVSNRCGCAPDLVKDGVNGWTFDPTDPEGLAALMLRMSGMDARERERMGDASRQIISQWGPERFSAGLLAAVKCAISRPVLRTSALIRWGLSIGRSL